MHDGHVSGASRTTGTLFRYRKAWVTLAVQETPGSVPILLLELAMQTGRFMQEMGAEHLRVALECEKKPPGAGAGIGRTRLLDEPLWAGVFCSVDGSHGAIPLRRHLLFRILPAVAEPR